jgi:capsular exopolysaccharide synthesis family protein
VTNDHATPEAIPHSHSDSSHAPRWWWPLRAHTRHLLLAGLPVALVIALLGFVREPQFESRTLVEVQAPVFAAATEESRVAGSLPMLMETQKSIVTSATVAGELREGLRVEIVPQTFLLALHYRARDAETARSGASAVAQAYIDYTVNTQVQEVRRAASLLIAKLDSVTQIPDYTMIDVGEADPQVTALSANPVHDLIPPLQVDQPENSALTGLSSAGQRVLGPVLESALVSQVVRSYDATLAQMISARVLDPASMPVEPLPITVGWWVLLGYLGTVAVPALVLAARFKWRDSLDFPSDVARTLARPCAASLPLAPAIAIPEFLADRPYSQALAGLRIRLQMLRPEPDPLEQFPKGRVILVTSSVHGEGKSTVAASLALAMGRTERVLLINADMRTSREFLGVPARAPGLSHLIAGAAQLRDGVHTLKEHGIDVIPAGVLPPNPQELLAGKRFRRILDMLQRRYDTIILDAPALGEVSDTLLVGRLCSDIVFVVAAGSTAVDQARAELRKLDMADMPGIHVVLNRTQQFESAPLPLWKKAS